MDDTLNCIINEDCIAGMDRMQPGTIDLVFADPPFNIGYEYDVYQDRLESDQYLGWSRQWISAVHRVLKTTGSFWLAIGDEYAAELKVISQQLGFQCRSWVIWYYTFGVNCKKKFTRSHAHLFHFVKDPENFVFRADEPENRIPSARQLVYNDKRANPKGRLPDDTWIIRPEDARGELTADDHLCWLEMSDVSGDSDRTWTLRPQDIENCFRPGEDTWYFPRVAGTFKERAGFHGCQMPEQLLGRIIRACTEPGAHVLDPFSGSGTTLAVAKKLGRNYTGFDLSAEYVRLGLSRLAAIRVGDALDGSAEPLLSAPNTSTGARAHAAQEKLKKGNLSRQGPSAEDVQEAQLRSRMVEQTLQGVADAFAQCHGGFSADRVVADPELNQQFIDACRRKGIAGDPRNWNRLLFQLRKAGRLAHLETTQATKLTWEECDPYLFAVEIAWQQMLDMDLAGSLDDFLCDPRLALRFDELTSQFFPGRSSLEYRWAALKLRKQAKTARVRSVVLKVPARLGPAVVLEEMEFTKLPESAGAYLLSGTGSKKIYAGETLNLRQRLLSQFHPDHDLTWRMTFGGCALQIFPTETHPADMLAWQSSFVTKFKPKLNLKDLQARS